MNTTDYTKQANNFLTGNSLKIRITLSNTKPAHWEPAGNHYRVTISRKDYSLMSGLQPRLVFDFWGSANDMERGQDPSPYDVLSCIASDSYCPSTFTEFCSEYGYDEDSVKALQTFRRADRFAKRLIVFFTEDELDALREIQ